MPADGLENPAVLNLAQKCEAIDHGRPAQKWREMRLQGGGNFVQIMLAERPGKRYMKLECG
jgi:hypothetical protein